MNTFRHLFYWSQVIMSVLITTFLGIVPLVRCLINHSDTFYVICFAAIIVNGYFLMYVPSVRELREYQNRKSNNQ